jgi:ATP-independent RNA helicase DbpA
VLDEADRMLDMGFSAIDTVVRQCPADRQTLLFSATYPGQLPARRRFMRDPRREGRCPAQANKIEQRWYEVVPARWTPCRLLATALSRALPFATPSSNAATWWRAAGPGLQRAGAVGELEQRERDEVLVQFANKSCSVLVATDVAARGLDIADLSAVINVDVTDPEVHIHRIGRTGRGDAEGLALNLVSMDEMGSVGKIEQLQAAPRSSSRWTGSRPPPAVSWCRRW